MRLVRDAGALILGLLLGAAAVSAFAQQAPPAPPATTVPDWVVRYAGTLEQRLTACERTLAQEQDKGDKLAKDLADSKAAAAKAAAPKKETK